MMSFGFSFDFDVQKLERKARAMEYRGLEKLGFQTRVAARESIMPGATASRPGNPPRDKTGVLKRFILYSLDKQTMSVVTGAKLLKRKSKDAAKALEHGGLAMNDRKKTIHVAARPFMEPAFEKIARRSIPSVFAGTLR